jgi:hypothetical protein
MLLGDRDIKTVVNSYETLLRKVQIYIVKARLNTASVCKKRTYAIRLFDSLSNHLILIKFDEKKPFFEFLSVFCGCELGP